MYRKFGKRLFDICLSLFALILLSPVILTVSLLVRIKLGRPVLFRQDRPGKNEKVFTLYKFRTMADYMDENGNLLPDSVRLTKFGEFLRRTSLDELPELYNILKGEMSFVGPRPLLIGYLSLYSEKQKRRHEVLPGLSGLAQVNGRNALSWETRFDLDVEYVDSLSFGLDCKIFFLTLWKAFVKQEGVTPFDEATMAVFTGNKEDVKIGQEE